MNCSLSILHVPPRDVPAQGRAHSGHTVLRARRGSERGGNYRARSWRFHFSIRTFRRLAGVRVGGVSSLAVEGTYSRIFSFQKQEKSLLLTAPRDNFIGRTIDLAPPSPAHEVRH